MRKKYIHRSMSNIKEEATQCALKSAKKVQKIFVKSIFSHKKICKKVQFDETMHCLPQRLKSTLFEIFSNRVALKEPAE